MCLCRLLQAFKNCMCNGLLPTEILRLQTQVGVSAAKCTGENYTIERLEATLRWKPDKSGRPFFVIYNVIAQCRYMWLRLFVIHQSLAQDGRIGCISLSFLSNVET